MGLNWTHSFGMLMTMAVLQGVGLGGARVGTETMVVDTAPAELRGTAVSVLYFCFDTGIAVGGLAMGTLAGLAGLGNGFVLVGATCVLTMVFFWSVTRQPVTR
jgi:MFS family permease